MLNILEFTAQLSLYRFEPRYQQSSTFAGPAETIYPALLRRPSVCDGPGVPVQDEVALRSVGDGADQPAEIIGLVTKLAVRSRPGLLLPRAMRWSRRQ